MSLDSKLKLIKQIKESEFFKYILNENKFFNMPKDKQVIVILNDVFFGTMDFNCIKLIDPQLDVEYLAEFTGNFKIVYGSDKKAKKVILQAYFKKEVAEVICDRSNINFQFENGSFITLDYTNDYKITDCSRASVIDSYLFRTPYKTFNNETTMMLELSDF